jgi:hypothetical protein
VTVTSPYENFAIRIHSGTAKTRRPPRTNEEIILMVIFAMVFASLRLCVNNAVDAGVENLVVG